MQKIILGILFPALTALAVFAQSGFAQSDPPLTFGNNFFVTGDFVVAGAQNMTTNFVTIGGNSYAMGRITIPDANPGIQPGSTSTCTIHGVTHTNCVPAGAQIVAALLYWQTVVKITTPTDPALDPAANGFFRPVFPGGPQTGYAIRGVNLVSQQTTVSFSNGGCTGSSTGKVVRTYRADVRAGLPQDANGNVLANGTYEVKLASTGSTTPITLGATLVIIYRVLSPNVPLNAIVIYDGAYAPGGALLTMTQTVQGFYDAATNPVSRLGHIVGQGKPNKFQNVFLSSLDQHGNNLNRVQLNGSGQPAFPGFYGGWDNPVWTFPEPVIGNPVLEDVDSVKTEVVPSTTQQGCVSWGAVIFSTTVKNTDGDGLLDVWKAPRPPNPNTPGYCDASVNEGVCRFGDPTDPAWVALPGATPGQKDVFVQLDYMCSVLKTDGTCDIRNGNDITQGFYSFDPRKAVLADGEDVVQEVTESFLGIGGGGGDTLTHHTPINLHVFPTHAIQEQAAPAAPATSCSDIPASPGQPLQLCPFPNQPGVVGWKGGLIFFKNQLVDTAMGNIDHDCTTSPPAASCVLRFQHGKKDSWHYALFAHAVGLPNWTLPDGTLTNVVQSGNMVTFTTSSPLGTLSPLGTITIGFDALGNPIQIQDAGCSNGRVTVNFAISNPNLNGTYCVQSPTSPTDTTFTINIGGNPTSVPTPYTRFTDPNLVVASGQAGQVSGFSDIGGQDSLITLGNWKPKLQTPKAKAGTYMHEFGHSLGLTHGGLYFDSLTSNNNDYTPTIEGNCKPNHQSVMNYKFQVDLLDKQTGVDLNGNPVYASVVDYSGQPLDNLNKLASQSPNPFTTTPTYKRTWWHGTASELGITITVINGVPTPTRLPVDCTGKLIPDGTDLYPNNDLTSLLSWEAHQDINLDRNTTTESPLHGHNDWTPTFDLITGTLTSPGVDLRQIGATGSLSAAGLGGNSIGGGLGGNSVGGGLGGSSIGGGLGGNSVGGGLGGNSVGGGLGGSSIGGGLGGNSIGGGVGEHELTQKIANSFTRPPTGLMAIENSSPRTITLNWTQPAFGEIVKYKVFRSDAGGPFNLIATLSGNPPATTFTDMSITVPVLCNTGGHRYFVTAVVISDITNAEQESVPSNTVSTGQNVETLTACYLPPVFMSPTAGSSPLQGSMVSVKWSVKDASNQNGVTFANNPGSNSLVAIGPISNDVVCAPGSVTGSTPRSTISSAGAGITFAANTFTFNWNTSLGFVGGGAFPPGCYLLEVDLDSGQPFVGQASAFQVQIYLSDVNESVLITTTSPLPDGTVGILYNQQLQETGGVAPLNWAVVSGSLPPGTPPAPSISLTSGTGVLSGYATTAGTYNFTAQVTDSIGDFGTRPLTLKMHIFVSTSQPPANPPFVATTTLSNAVVGSPYNNTVYESGGVGATPFTWAIVSGSLTLNGSPAPDGSLGTITFQPNTVAGGNNGTLSGTPTAPGTYTFTAMVTDSAGNTGTQTLTLNVVDALFGDLIVADPSPSSGTLFRITPDGSVIASIASISNGQPNGVAVDANTGNIYAAVTGTPSVVKVTRLGVVSTLTSGLPLKNPVAVAVDNSGNVYVGDNQADAIYKFNSSGTQVGANGTATANAFAPLPASSVMDVRLAFDTNGNLIAASDKVNGASGVIEVDQINTSTGTPTVLYNTTVNAGLTDTLTAVNASANITSFAITNNVVTFQGANNFTAGTMVQIKGLTVGTYLNGQILTVLSNGLSGTQFEANFNNPAVPSTNDSGTVTASAAIMSFAISNNIVTFQAANNFTAGTMVQISSLMTGTYLNGQTLTVLSAGLSGTQFEANFNNNNVPVPSTNDSGTATASATITAFAISNNIVTLQATNTFAAGTMVQINGLTTGTYLNGQTLTVLSTGLSGTQFEANFNNPNVPSTNDAGTATSQTAAYTGTFSPALPVGSPVAISGFTNNGNNSPINSPFTVLSCTSTTLVVNNPNGVTETHAGTATFGIASVGGVATFPDGSFDVADSAAQSIFKITNPGTPSMAITTLINGPAIGTTALCCNISGMANPPSQQPNTTNLFLTLNGVGGPPARLQLAVPEKNTVTTIVTGTAAPASVTAASGASGGNTTYSGTFSPTIPANSLVTITGFANAANNGQFVVVSSTPTQLVVNNPNGVAETPTNPGSAIFTLVFANDVAWYTKTGGT